jgi:quinolinate synthase
MKMNTLEKIANTLETLKPEITLPPELIERARLPLTRMLALTRGESVTWPARFQL